MVTKNCFVCYKQKDFWIQNKNDFWYPVLDTKNGFLGTNISILVLENRLLVSKKSMFCIKKDRNVGELLCLIHSEISEAMEGARKGLMDNHLNHKSMMEVELADAVIRIFDLAESRSFNLGETIYEKLEYNKSRADHKLINRLQEGGKKF